MPSATRGDGKDATSRRGVYLLTCPRSASNLFQKILSNQDVADSGYFFYEPGLKTCFILPQGSFSSRPELERQEVWNGYYEGYAKLQDFLGEAENKGQKVLVKEHAMFFAQPRTVWTRSYDEDKELPLLNLGGQGESHTNGTVCPDSLLQTLQPIFQIRNPMLMFPSMARASPKIGIPHSMAMDPSMTLRYSKELYDWYSSNEQAAKPLVIEADDIMNDRNAVRQVCSEAGLDPEALIFEWDSKEESRPFWQVFKSIIDASTGIVPGLDSKGLSLESETKKWKAEFGNEQGEALALRVKEAMPDYEYLYSRRTVSA